MRNIEIGGYIRISKKEAEKRYNAGEIIRLCACKVSPVNVWGVYVDCQKEEFPHIGNDGFNTIVPRNREFETVVNAFRRLKMKRALEKSLQPLRGVPLLIWFFMCLKVIPVFLNIRRCKCVYSFADLAFTGSNNS